MDISLLRGSDNRIFTGSGQDVIYAGTSDVIPGGSGHDAIWALDNDTFIIGSPYNRGLGGVGNDKLSIIEGVGGNYLNGGSCTDQLWLISGLGYLPAAKQFVIDFKPVEDKVGGCKAWVSPVSASSRWVPTPR
jgi:glycerophosphoryl diester phosphodiesterase